MRSPVADSYGGMSGTAAATPAALARVNVREETVKIRKSRRQEGWLAPTLSILKLS